MYKEHDTRIPFGDRLAAEAIFWGWLETWGNIKTEGRNNLELAKDWLSRGFSGLITPNDVSLAGDIALMHRTKKLLRNYLSGLSAIVAQKFSTDDTKSDGGLVRAMSRRVGFGLHYMIQPQRFSDSKAILRQLVAQSQEKIPGKELLGNFFMEKFAPIRETLATSGNMIFLAFEAHRSENAQLQSAAQAWPYIFPEGNFARIFVLPANVSGAEYIHDQMSKFHPLNYLRRATVTIRYGKPITAQEAMYLSAEFGFSADDVAMCAVAAITSPSLRGYYRAEQFQPLIQHFEAQNSY